MKYFLPIWLATLILTIVGLGPTNDLTVHTEEAGAKLIGGLTPDDPPPDMPDLGDGLQP